MAWLTPRTWVAGEVVKATVFNAHWRDQLNWLHDGEVGWSTLTLAGSWVNYDTTPFGPARYKKVGPFVEVQGLIKSGAIGATPFATLPAGYRPGINIIQGASANGATAVYAELRVGTDGAMIAQFGSNAYFSIQTRFLAEL